jgi:hypothetical protein
MRSFEFCVLRKCSNWMALMEIWIGLGNLDVELEMKFNVLLVVIRVENLQNI